MTSPEYQAPTWVNEDDPDFIEGVSPDLGAGYLNQLSGAVEDHGQRLGAITPVVTYLNANAISQDAGDNRWILQDNANGFAPAEATANALAALPFRADNVTTAGAAIGKVPAVVQLSPLAFGLVDQAASGDLPEFATSAQTAAVGTPGNLVGKLTRYDTTGSVSGLTQPLPPATAGRVLALALDAATRTKLLTYTADGSDVLGSGSATSGAISLVGEVITLHCTTAGRWRVTSGHRPFSQLVTLFGTPVGSPPVVKPTGDGRAGVWEYTHNDTTGYIFHLLMGSGSGPGAWIAGIGIDAGEGNGFIFRNKATGIGLKIEQTATVSSATAYGMSVEQKNAVAPAVFMEQKIVTGGAAPLLSLISYETDTTKHFFQYQGANGKGGFIRSADGVLALSADIEGAGAIGFRARSQSTVTAPFRNHAILAAEEGVGAALTFFNSSGASGSWWPFRLRGNGSNLIFETGGSSSAVGTFGTANEIMRIRNNQISWFGATAVGKRTGWGVATGTATRTTFDTTSVTLPQLAERVKALIDDLNATTGYGLLAA